MTVNPTDDYLAEALASIQRECADVQAAIQHYNTEISHYNTQISEYENEINEMTQVTVRTPGATVHTAGGATAHTAGGSTVHTKGSTVHTKGGATEHEMVHKYNTQQRAGFQAKEEQAKTNLANATQGLQNLLNKLSNDALQMNIWMGSLESNGKYEKDDQQSSPSHSEFRQDLKSVSSLTLELLNAFSVSISARLSSQKLASQNEPSDANSSEVNGNNLLTGANPVPVLSSFTVAAQPDVLFGELSFNKVAETTLHVEAGQVPFSIGELIDLLDEVQTDASQIVQRTDLSSDQKTALLLPFTVGAARLYIALDQALPLQAAWDANPTSPVAIFSTSPLKLHMDPSLEAIPEAFSFGAPVEPLQKTALETAPVIQLIFAKIASVLDLVRSLPFAPVENAHHTAAAPVPAPVFRAQDASVETQPVIPGNKEETIVISVPTLTVPVSPSAEETPVISSRPLQSVVTVLASPSAKQEPVINSSESVQPVVALAPVPVATVPASPSAEQVPIAPTPLQVPVSPLPVLNDTVVQAEAQPLSFVLLQQIAQLGNNNHLQKLQVLIQSIETSPSFITRILETGTIEQAAFENGIKSFPQGGSLSPLRLTAAEIANSGVEKTADQAEALSAVSFFGSALEFLQHFAPQAGDLLAKEPEEEKEASDEMSGRVPASDLQESRLIFAV